ncbi:hypothetical protein C8A05DRAFT_34541 [Staphylotrichum tortipilum]|uniref:LysM domain-containing protein n=1 Tax=Staphylotrichum tortipilum TaxID=2831512 RepID=A0AAN6RSW6_9PEZI|nr:hypothetical protein C8A05DRAFT_34541 [Staphylotrichum longicolle]
MSTVPSNGVTTPTPTQTGMVGNYKINPGDTCNTVTFYNGPILTEYFVQWNTGVGGMECRSLQAGTYACVGIAG